MIEKESEDVKQIESSGKKPRYRVTPDYTAWMDEDKFVIQVALPGVAKENIHMKALEDYFTLRAERDAILYSLDLDMNFKVEPTKVSTKYAEGLLRVEFERYKPLEHAYDVPIE